MKKGLLIIAFLVVIILLFVVFEQSRLREDSYNTFVLVLYDDIPAYEGAFGSEIDDSSTYWFWNGKDSDHILRDLADRGFPISLQQFELILISSNLDERQVEGISIRFDGRQEDIESVRILWNLHYRDEDGTLEGALVDKTININ